MGKHGGEFVALGQQVCIVCGQLFDSGDILIHKNLRPIKEEATIQGWGMCPEHKRLFDEGYLACVEAIAPAGATVLKQKNAIRTGNIMHLRREAANHIFNVKIPDDLPMIFIEPGVIEKVQSLQEDQS